ncbi:glycosyltransferase family 4 protein [Enterobacter hormaechei subsp. xiangfangensis]|nr:glycosyltransferase family 4 protein [Enterobacter hormaechei subsp. xiangfangensis]
MMISYQELVRTFPKTGVLGRIAAKLAGVPIVIHTVHGFSFESTNNKAISFVYKFVEFVSAFFSDRIICLHNEDKKKCINILKVPKEKICILPNGVDLDKFHPVEEKQKKLLRANFNLQHASLIFTMVGRLWDQKNPLLLVQAAQKYLRCNSESNDVFILVGDGDLRIKIEELAAKEINAGKIILLGWRNDIAEILSLSDVFILPSKWEGMPLAILEAQAAGLPCIASDIAGNKSLIKDNINGILFKNDSVNSLLTKIKLMSLADERKRISHNAMDIVKKDHCIQSRIKEIESLYESLLN